MWQTFWDSFESAVHLNSTLSNVQKFCYLKAQLVDQALQTVEGFTLTNVHYEEALCLLKERYGQPHKITNAYMQSLIELPAPQNNVSSLRSFHDKLEAYIRGLDALGIVGEHYGALLIPIILNKLPGIIRREYARKRHRFMALELSSTLHTKRDQHS